MRIYELSNEKHNDFGSLLFTIEFIGANTWAGSLHVKTYARIAAVCVARDKSAPVSAHEKHAVLYGHGRTQRNNLKKLYSLVLCNIT